VYYGSALTEASACLGQDVYIVGGANSAGQAAVYLSRHAKSVTILVRGPSLEASMSYYLIKQIEDVPNISVRTCTEVTEAIGEDHLENLRLRNTATGDTETVDAQLLFLFIGAAPLTDWLDGVVVRDSRGFVVAGPDLSVGGERPRRLGPRPDAVPPGDQHPGSIRGRGRAGGVGQAGGFGRRRRRARRHARTPLSGEEMSALPAEPQQLSCRPKSCGRCSCSRS
jgi:hypothetical protein